MNLERLVDQAIGRHQAGRLDEAWALYERVLARRPDHPRALWLAGLLAGQLGRTALALERLGAAARLPTADGAVHAALGQALLTAGDTDGAEAAFRRALTLDPRLPAAHDGLGALLARRDRFAEAAGHFRAALARAPELVATRYRLATALLGLGERERAIDEYRGVLARAPDHEGALAKLSFELRLTCDWDPLPAIDRRLDTATDRALAAGRCPHEQPFAALARTDDPATCLRLGRARAAEHLRRAGLAAVPARPAARPRADGRIVLGYLAGTWREHPVTHSLAAVLPRHDRARFVVHGYGWGATDAGDYRARAIAGCDRFVTLDALDDAAAAARIRADGVDIAIDLMGYTEGNRFGILLHRPAPVQVAWQGYVGTTGSPVLDYLITDRTLTPPDLTPYYSERFAWLPEPFMAVARDPIPDAALPSRAAAGLPADAVVYGWFGGAQKLSAEVFGLWLRILAAVPDGVLWTQLPDAVRPRLRARATAAGLDPGRLIFAERCGLALHLAGIGLADLAFDTFPYGGGTTTADLLSAGVPVLTVPGRGAASRMGASLLRSQGLADLVAPDADALAAAAVALGRDRDRREVLRARVRAGRAGPSPPGSSGRSRRSGRGIWPAGRPSRSTPPPTDARNPTQKKRAALGRPVANLFSKPRGLDEDLRIAAGRREAERHVQDVQAVRDGGQVLRRHRDDQVVEEVPVLVGVHPDGAGRLRERADDRLVDLHLGGADVERPQVDQVLVGVEAHLEVGDDVALRRRGRIAGGVEHEGVAVAGATHQEVVAGAAVHDVAAGAAVHDVAAGAAADGVVAGVALDDVVAGVAVHDILAGAAGDEVVAVAAADVVVAAFAVDVVVAGVTAQHVVVDAAVDVVVAVAAAD
jgi:predicted O-linked N-acetylglucosamine transferase (SPINDLY family)